MRSCRHFAEELDELDLSGKNIPEEGEETRESGRTHLPPPLTEIENYLMVLQVAQGNGKDGQGTEKMQKLEEITRTTNTD